MSEQRSIGSIAETTTPSKTFLQKLLDGVWQSVVARPSEAAGYRVGDRRCNSANRATNSRFAAKKSYPPNSFGKAHTTASNTAGRISSSSANSAAKK